MPDETQPAGGIFISHCHEDNDLVVDLASFLRGRGHTVYVDVDSLRGGDTLGQAIARFINASSKVLVVLSKVAIKKRWVLTEIEWTLNREINEGLSLLVPYCLDAEALDWFKKDVRLGCRLSILGFGHSTGRGFEEIVKALPSPQPSPSARSVEARLTDSEESRFKVVELIAQARRLLEEGNVGDAVTLLRRAASQAREVGPERGLSAALDAQKTVLMSQGHLEEANSLSGNTPLVAPGSLPPRIGRYEILEWRGEGGFGIVHRARDTTLDREVALKILPAAISTDSREAERFAREARATARLDHRGIVRIYEAGEEDRLRYLALEYVPGTTLRDSMKAGQIRSPRRAVEILVELAEAVAYAHEHGVLHLDLKPENVLLGEDGGPKIIDFGLARIMGDGASHRSAELAGTLDYISPEQLAGKASPLSDVWALGAILYEMLVGRPPFVAGMKVALMFQIADPALRPERPRAIDPAIDLAIEDISMQCLAKDEKSRLASASDLARQLRLWLATPAPGDAARAGGEAPDEPGQPGAPEGARRRRVVFCEASESVREAFQGRIAARFGDRIEVSVLSNFDALEQAITHDTPADIVVSDIDIEPNERRRIVERAKQAWPGALFFANYSEDAWSRLALLLDTILPERAAGSDARAREELGLPAVTPEGSFLGFLLGELRDALYSRSRPRVARDPIPVEVPVCVGIEVTCSNCDTVHRISPTAEGTLLECKKCGFVTDLPQAAVSAKGHVRIAVACPGCEKIFKIHPRDQGRLLRCTNRKCGLFLDLGRVSTERKGTGSHGTRMTGATAAILVIGAAALALLIVATMARSIVLAMAAMAAVALALASLVVAIARLVRRAGRPALEEDVASSNGSSIRPRAQGSASSDENEGIDDAAGMKEAPTTGSSRRRALAKKKQERILLVAAAALAGVMMVALLAKSMVLAMAAVALALASLVVAIARLVRRAGRPVLEEDVASSNGSRIRPRAQGSASSDENEGIDDAAGMKEAPTTGSSRRRALAKKKRKRIVLVVAAPALVVGVASLVVFLATRGGEELIRPLIRPRITSPAEGALVGSSPVSIEGTTDPAVSVVWVWESPGALGSRVAVTGGRFEAEVPAVKGWNAVRVADAEGRQATVRFEADFAAPRIEVTAPTKLARFEGNRLTIRGNVDDPEATLRVTGVAAALGADGSFRVEVAFPAPMTRIELVAEDRLGRATRIVVEIRRVAGLPFALPAGWKYIGVNEEGFEEVERPRDKAVMIYVPAGEFLMGEHRQVYLAPYFIDKYEVTWAKYLAFCDATGRVRPARPERAGDEHPVVNVTWDDARDYCEWAQAELPTEAQWEKAARGTDGREYPWGNAEPDRTTSSQPAAVGSYPAGASPYASPYGCQDMAGSVLEWCADWYVYYQNAPGRNPPGPGAGSDRVVRGGSWWDVGVWIRCARRDGDDPASSRDVLGFRAARLP